MSAVSTTKLEFDPLELADEMKRADLPADFIVAAMAQARVSRGIRGLLAMWMQEGEPAFRDEIVADIQDLLDDWKRPRGPVDEQYVRFDDLEWISEHIMEFKTSLLSRLDDEGITLTELSERTGMPLSSLSRFFNTASMPRRTTLLKIAKAVDFSAVEIATDWSY